MRALFACSGRPQGRSPFFYCILNPHPCFSEGVPKCIITTGHPAGPEISGIAAQGTNVGVRTGSATGDGREATGTTNRCSVSLRLAGRFPEVTVDDRSSRLSHQTCRDDPCSRPEPCPRPASRKSNSSPAPRGQRRNPLPGESARRHSPVSRRAPASSVQILPQAFGRYPQSLTGGVCGARSPRQCGIWPA